MEAYDGIIAAAAENKIRLGFQDDHRRDGDPAVASGFPYNQVSPPAILLPRQPSPGDFLLPVDMAKLREYHPKQEVPMLLDADRRPARSSRVGRIVAYVLGGCSIAAIAYGVYRAIHALGIW
jgi:hypothetical protein